MDHFDAVVLGTGTAGQTAAHDLAVEGWSVAIIESSSNPGGTCALHGCQAKKWLYEVTETVARCHHLSGLGISTPPQTNWQHLIAAKNAFTSTVPDSTVNSLTGSGVTYLKGRGVLIDNNTVLVGTDMVQADYILIATGSTPRQLPFEGSELICNSNDFLDLDHLPEKIAFIGGGFISYEFAHFAARLGGLKDHIHIVLRGKQPLRSFDSEMVDILSAASRQEGIKIHTGAEIQAITKTGNRYHIQLGTGNTLEVDLVVHGAGRIPNIAELGLDIVKVKVSEHGIMVNSRMQTSVANIYAIGDCVDSPQLARVADQEAHTAVRNIIADRQSSQATRIDYSSVPVVLFTYPQLAMVGKTEDQLQKEGERYWRSFGSNLTWPTYRRIGMRNAAFKILVNEEGKLLGAHILSDNATGLINCIKQAMRDGMNVSELYENNIMAPYPSRESDLIYMLAPLLDE